MDGKLLPKRLVLGCGSLAPDLVGRRFGSLTIVSQRTEGTAHNLAVEVECRDCGQRQMTRYHNMRKRPDRVGCSGCKPRRPVTVPYWLYQRCQGQKDRCCNPRSTSYARYGGRGIEFRFEGPNAAAQWVADNLGVSHRSMQLDRIDNDGHYEPGNLRWAHPVQNIANSRRSKGYRDRFLGFRQLRPEVRYSDRSLGDMIRRGMTDAEIAQKWAKFQASNLTKRSGTFSMQGPYRDLPPTDA